MFHGQVVSCHLSLEYSSLWALLSSPNFYPRSHLLVLQHYKRRSRQALLIEQVTAPSAQQSSGGRHGVFTRVLLTHFSNPQLTSWDNNSSGRIPSVTALYTGESVGKQDRAIPLDTLLIGWQENANGGSAQKNIKQNKHWPKKWTENDRGDGFPLKIENEQKRFMYGLSYHWHQQKSRIAKDFP